MGPEGAVGVVQFGQELWIGVMVEDVIDAAVGFRGEVVVDELQQQVLAAGQELGHDCFIEGEVHLIEADCRHGPRMQLLLKLMSHQQLFGVETVISEQHPDLDGDFQQVFDDLLGLRFVPGVHFGDAVQFIQDLTCGVVNKHLHRGFACHGAEDLFLDL